MGMPHRLGSGKRLHDLKTHGEWDAISETGEFENISPGVIPDQGGRGGIGRFRHATPLPPFPEMSKEGRTPRLRPDWSGVQRILLQEGNRLPFSPSSFDILQQAILLPLRE